jgi:hypothetical protein
MLCGAALINTINGGTKMTQEFFNHLFGECDGQTEIRLLPSGKQKYFVVDELDKLTSYVKQNSKQDCYFGVATRDGKGGTKENIVNVPAVWIDADFKETPRKELYKRLKQFPFSPSIIVKSGGGAHMYWCLDEPVGKDEIERIEDCNRRIAQKFGGDMNACDASRILRVPNTKNFKYKPPRDVKVTRLDNFVYRLDDFLDLLPPVKIKKANKKTNGKPEGWLLEALQGVGDGKRNATAASIAGYFVNRLSYRDILTILLAVNCHNSPPMDEAEVVNIAHSITRYRSTNEAPDEQSRERIKVQINRR